jgi:hypothetical protein
MKVYFLLAVLLTAIESLDYIIYVPCLPVVWYTCVWCYHKVMNAARFSILFITQMQREVFLCVKLLTVV